MLIRPGFKTVGVEFVKYCDDIEKQLGCKVVAVFDGNNPPAKRECSEKRARIEWRYAKRTARRQVAAGRPQAAERLAKQAARVTDAMRAVVIAACREANIDIVQAPYEVRILSIAKRDTGVPR